MKRMKRTIHFATFLIASALIIASQAGTSDLGALTFPNSGAPEAQNAFIRGVLLLHSFEYEDAREAFQQAQEIDADFVMAYWGEAMTHNHPLWRQQDYAAAVEALNRYAPDPAATARPRR
jgi:tetratricopeptide (TPR) repeat protein